MNACPVAAYIGPGRLPSCSFRIPGAAPQPVLNETHFQAVVTYRLLCDPLGPGGLAMGTIKQLPENSWDHHPAAPGKYAQGGGARESLATRPLSTADPEQTAQQLADDL